MKFLVKGKGEKYFHFPAKFSENLPKIVQEYEGVWLSESQMRGFLPLPPCASLKRK